MSPNDRPQIELLIDGTFQVVTSSAIVSIEYGPREPQPSRRERRAAARRARRDATRRVRP